MTDEKPEADPILRNWIARDYLDYYYGGNTTTVPDDESAMMRFVEAALRKIGTSFATALEIGCGPVLHHAAHFVGRVERMDMADVQEGNLEEIRRWLRRDPGAFDWSVFIGGKQGILEIEASTSPVDPAPSGSPAGRARVATVAEREAQMRERIHLMLCDMLHDLPLGKPVTYPLVAAYYCTEWVIPSVEGWRETMRKVTSLVAPGGWLFLFGVHATDYCVLDGRPVGCAHVTDTEIRRTLGELGFDPTTMRVDVTPGLRPEVSGIQGTFMSYARRGS